MARFSEPQHDTFRRLNDSIAFDWRLASSDVELSRAHVAMLARAGIISTGDRDALHEARERLGREDHEGSFLFADEDEHFDMVIERRVTELAGLAGGMLHAARSRKILLAMCV